MSYPRFFLVRQSFPRPRLGGLTFENPPEDTAADTAQAIDAAVVEQLTACGFATQISAGQSVAITAGSRGIANIVSILRSAASFVRNCGGQPFLVPAMGSHGGGTAEGQVQVLANLGITEESVGCPIRSSMNTRVLGELSGEELARRSTDSDAREASLHPPRGMPVHFDEHALSADHTLVINRIKPHTHFAGPAQSGLVKMLVIGLGKHEGAKVAHRAALDYGWQPIAQAGAKLAIAQGNCRVGLAIIENGFDETARIVGLRAEDFISHEPELLQEAESLLAKLPFPAADVLIIDELGKNISGAGMDTVVVGRKPGRHAPRIKRIWVRRLTEATHGNATGLGEADFCSPRVREQIDHHVTRINCTTGGNPRAGMVPLCYETEQATAVAVFSTLGLCPAEEAHALWISSTRHLEVVACSEALLPAAEQRKDLEILSEPSVMEFAADGVLADLLAASACK